MISSDGSQKLISVVMPVYNGGDYLSEAIESILNQTYANFEFLIIDDGSQDKSLDIIQRYAAIDQRIKVISRQNKGLIATLNEGIGLAKGDYIARMDADDISLPDRFSVQLDYMQARQVDICGSAIQKFNEKGDLDEEYYPETHAEIKYRLLFMCAFAHPTVLMKKSIFNVVQYSASYLHAEDYKLWVDSMLLDCKMANIPQVLLKYRRHDMQISEKKAFLQRQNAYKASLFYIGKSACFQELLDRCKKIKFQAKYNDMRSLLLSLRAFKEDANLPDYLFLDAANFLFRMATPMQPSMFFAYCAATKGLKKGLKMQILIFSQSFLFLSRETKVYQKLKRFFAK